MTKLPPNPEVEMWEDELWDVIAEQNRIDAGMLKAVADPERVASFLCEATGIPSLAPCWPLLVDPVATLRNPDQPLTHLCVRTVEMLNLQWRRRYGVRMFGNPEAELVSYLFPSEMVYLGVGRDNLRHQYNLLRERSARYKQEEIERLALVDGDVWLHIPLHTVVNGTLIEFYGLVGMEMVDPSAPPPPQWTKPLRPHFVVEGNPLDGDVQAVMLLFRNWWVSNSGLAISGRPRNIPDIGRTKIMIHNYLASLGPDKRPTLTGFLNSDHGFAYRGNTWARYTKRWGRTWTQILADVQHEQ